MLDRPRRNISETAANMALIRALETAKPMRCVVLHGRPRPVVDQDASSAVLRSLSAAVLGAVQRTLVTPAQILLAQRGLRVVSDLTAADYRRIYWPRCALLNGYEFYHAVLAEKTNAAR